MILRSSTLRSALLLIVLSPAVSAVDRYVDPTAPPGGDGSSWREAHRHLADALGQAGAGEVVRVAQGVHVPDRTDRHPEGSGDRADAFVVPSGVMLIGGYAGSTAADPDARDPELFVTRLDGLGMAYHVVRGDGWSDATRVDGFTITGGRADASGDDALGGGLLLGAAAAGTIIDCRFEDNHAVQGGGAAVRAGGTARFTRVRFAGNRATVTGAGLQSTNSDVHLDECTFTENDAIDSGWGGGMFILGGAPALTLVRFEGNEAAHGAGLYATAAAVQIDGVDFIGNRARLDGAGAYFEHTALASTVLARCTFEDNLALNDGGGVYERSIGGGVTMLSTTFHANVAVNDGGAIHASGEAPVEIDGVTITDNLAGDRGGGLFFQGGSAESIVRATTVRGNAAEVGGGAMLVASAITIAACTFEENVADDGGGLYADAASARLEDTAFRRNSANASGGGAFLFAGALVVDGCTFEENDADTTGAGLQTREDASQIQDCRFESNRAVGFGSGGGAACGSGANTQFTDCMFVGNASDFGAGIASNSGASPTITRCAFEDNAALGGAAVSVVTAHASLADCTMRGNRAEGSTVSVGGGLSVVSGSADVAGSTFDGNHADADGGAIAARDATLTLDRIVVVGNEALDRGGGLFADESDVDASAAAFAGNTAATLGGGATISGGDVAFVNCAFTGNRVTGLLDPTDDECAEPGFGGGIAVRTGSPRFTNCTFVGNRAECDGLGGGASVIFATFRNCVLWQNEDPTGTGESAQLHDLAGLATVAYSCVDGLETIKGPGNIGEDPQLRDPAGPDGLIGTADDDVRLRPGSPAVDAADNTALAEDVATDLGQRPRFVDDPETPDTGVPDARPPVDIGAHEFDPFATCAGDVDGDGSVGVGDLLGVLRAWGPCDGCAADLDGDDVVGVADLLIVLADWGC